MGREGVLTMSALCQEGKSNHHANVDKMRETALRAYPFIHFPSPHDRPDTSTGQEMHIRQCTLHKNQCRSR